MQLVILSCRLSLKLPKQAARKMSVAEDVQASDAAGDALHAIFSEQVAATQVWHAWHCRPLSSPLNTSAKTRCPLP